MFKIKVFLICIFFTSLQLYAGKIIHSYTVSISKDLNTLYVKAHFGPTDFYYLYSGSKASAKYTKKMYFISDKSHIYKPENEELELSQNAAGQTLFYEFDLSAALGKQRWSAARLVGDDISIPPDLWLWRPYSLQENEHINVHFDFPTGIKYSTPWIPLGNNTLRIPDTPVDWPSASVFGTFTTDTIRIKNCSFAVSFMDGTYKTTPAELKEWLKGAARSVCNIYGDFPVNHVQILIFPGKPGSEPVPFGMVLRGGGITINFYIDPSRPLEEFIADWTATHEMSHSLLPMTDRQDAWLSEGLATYYQYILMGRDKRLTEQQTWQRIYNGFQKGIRGSKGMTLQETAHKMHRLRAFRYVYWSGAAMLFKADIALRQQSKGEKSLDTVLKEIKKNILPQNKSWSGREMIKIMDSLSQTTVFSDIYKQCINSHDFPVQENFLKKLGIIIETGQVKIDNNAPLAYIRKNLLENDH